MPNGSAIETINIRIESENAGRRSPISNLSAEREESVTCHGNRWNEADVNDPISGSIPHKHWWVSLITGARIMEGYEVNGLSPYDYFMWMFPISRLREIITYIKIRFAQIGKTNTASTEILKFFGVMILLTRFEFGSRRHVWLTSSKKML